MLPRLLPSPDPSPLAPPTSANAQINSAKSVAAAPVVKFAADPVADAVAVGPIAADPAIDNKRGNILIIFLIYLFILNIIFIPIILFISFTAHRPRGTAAGIRRQQDRFMRFLYQLSPAHYNWGKRPRPR